MTSAQVHERNALTVKGRKISWFECNRPLPSSKNPRFQNEARRTTFLMKMSIIWMRMKNDFHIKGWRLRFPRKKLEFKSSEMTKNVSITHKVERSFFCTLQFVKLIQLLTLRVLRIWFFFCHFGKFKLFGWEKNYIWISLPLASITSWHHYQWWRFFPQVLFFVCFLFPYLYWHFFFSGTHLCTCVKQVLLWILFC